MNARAGSATFAAARCIFAVGGLLIVCALLWAALIVPCLFLAGVL